MPNLINRRALAALLPLGAAAAGSAASPASTGQPATMEHYASLEFEAHPPGGETDLLSPAEWADQAEVWRATLYFALVSLQRDHNGCAAAAAKDSGLMLEFCNSLSDLVDRFRGYAEVLETANIRVMAGLARHAVATLTGEKPAQLAQVSGKGGRGHAVATGEA